MPVKAKKRLGQHFLRDRSYLIRIAEAASLRPEDVVLEIGPGEGDLTELLLERAGRVIAVEIDPELVALLRSRFQGEDRLALIQGDVLKLDLTSLLSEHLSVGSKAKVVANIPYYITSPIIEKLIESRRVLGECVLTVQREVARRICAAPGSKEYGSLTVLVQYFADVELLFDIPPGAFRPKPKVTSSVVRISFRERPRVEVKDEGFFFRVVRAAFGQRRKMIKNALRSLGLADEAIRSAMERAGISLEERAESLTLEQLSRLADELFVSHA
ncbi:ribosomal RNA small subunit methyltransferase A [Candidatus Poribacteria bacterium]|nr:MAG: ribosomal RNA small subunit methyltransferase A [Candidatus Poribacteria bacterium]